MKSTSKLVFKKIKCIPKGEELGAFVNTIYNELFNKIHNINEELRNEKEPLHYAILQTRLEEAKDTLKMFERVVDDSTEFVEVANVSK